MRVLMTKVYRDWINALKDRTIRARIQVRVDRLVHGNPGQFRNLTEGVSELKIDLGPGYRVYNSKEVANSSYFWPAATSPANRRILS